MRVLGVFLLPKYKRMYLCMSHNNMLSIKSNKDTNGRFYSTFYYPSFRFLNQLLFPFTPYCTKTIKNTIHFNKSFYKDLKKNLAFTGRVKSPKNAMLTNAVSITRYFTFQGPESLAGNGPGSHFGGLQSHRMFDGHQLNHH